MQFAGKDGKSVEEDPGLRTPWPTVQEPSRKSILLKWAALRSKVGKVPSIIGGLEMSQRKQEGD